MAAPIKPALRRAFGNDSWGFSPVVANVLIPKLAELTAGFNLSCSLFGEQGDPTVTQEKVTLARLLCETQQYEVNGSVTTSMPDLQVSFQPQSKDGDDGRKAWSTLVDGLSGFLWRRQDFQATADLAVGQRVDVLPVQLGTKVPVKTSTDAAGVYAFTQGASIIGAPGWNVALVA